ncbi:DUF6607 family protein [Bizionia sediminis]|uniref:DUF6607 family protein n=1 Tax=Bizionia sediminis TaxID=1737064 RepID=A0ABW5KT12_9FLAO
MKNLVLSLVLIISLFSEGYAQSKKKLDRQAIKAMCGCYEVNFNFAETFNYSKDSTYVPSAVKHDRGLEWVELVADTDNAISMQHLLIVPTPKGPYIVKHWRQDWEYQNRHLYVYNHDNKWDFVTLPKKAVKGQWTQRVFQVDDSPRYEGTASWVHVDGKSYWENTTPAPLPRREYTTRSDYNVTMRTNRHEIVENGWIHDQDNDKILRSDTSEDLLIAQEKGYNTYVKVPDEKCKPAQDYWTENHEKWALVRAKWDAVFDRNKNLSLKEKVDNKVLFKYLLDNDNFKTSETINPLIDAFVN